MEKPKKVQLHRQMKHRDSHPDADHLMPFAAAHHQPQVTEYIQTLSPIHTELPPATDIVIDFPPSPTNLKTAKSFRSEKCQNVFFQQQESNYFNDIPTGQSKKYFIFLSYYR